MTPLSRKATGSYYTPASLVDELLQASLAPVIDGAHRMGKPILSIRVVDPSCGDGAFLVAAMEMLASAIGGDLTEARRSVARECLTGVDADPVAAEACRARLAEAAGLPPEEITGIVCGDSLLDPPPALSEGSFDCLAGNPPFLHAIERTHRQERRRLLARLHPELGGTADEAYHFLAQAMRLVRPGGRIGLVLPRTMLVAPAAAALRDPALSGWYPRHLHPLEKGDWFEDSQVYVCLIAFGPSGPCTAIGSSGKRVSGPVKDTNWWRAWRTLLGEPTPPAHAGVVVGDVFDVRAGMTVGDAYVIRSQVRDEPDGDALKLVTTGLVEPGECLWGQRECRYLHRTIRHPRLSVDPSWGAPLKRRLVEARRPKIIVAGLSRRIECFLDTNGEYAGSVATFAIFHPMDDLQALQALCNALLAEEATQRFISDLGATALTGGSMRMTKDFLKAFPWKD